MPVYVETAEGLVKPLVILLAAIMPYLLLSLSSHDIVVPFVLADSFVLTTHFISILTLQTPPTLFITFVPPIVPVVLLHMGTVPTPGRTM